MTTEDKRTTGERIAEELKQRAQRVIKDRVGNVGKVLREFRTLRGLSRAALSALTGLSAQTIYNVERGASRPSFETLSTLAESLAVPIEAFRADPETLNQIKILLAYQRIFHVLFIKVPVDLSP